MFTPVYFFLSILSSLSQFDRVLWNHSKQYFSARWKQHEKGAGIKMSQWERDKDSYQYYKDTKINDNQHVYFNRQKPLKICHSWTCHSTVHKTQYKMQGN